MKPSKKGWLKDYLEIRKRLSVNDQHEMQEARKAFHPDQSLYRLLQPTGLMYGHPIQLADNNTGYPDDWKHKDKMKVLLAESFINSGMLFSQNVDSAEGFSERLMRTMESVGDFYSNVYPELAVSNRGFFGKKKNALEVVEQIIEKRVSIKTDPKINFWSAFFNNSLLFLDIFFFGKWINTNSEKAISEFFKHEKESLKFSIIKVMGAAAYADKNIGYEEKKLFQYFLDSTELSARKKKQAMESLETGLHLEDIILPHDSSWILRKYFLELAILTIFADKTLEDSEMDFLCRFCKKIGFSKDDCDTSLMAIEGFLLENWEKLEYLQENQNYDKVSDRYIRRMSKIADKHTSRIQQEMKENKRLNRLIDKGKSAELTSEEKEKLRNELIAVLKKVPTFLIISLPTTYLSLPVLLKILPNGIFTEQKALEV